MAADDAAPDSKPSLGALKGKKLAGLPLPLLLGGLVLGVVVAVYFRRRSSGGGTGGAGERPEAPGPAPLDPSAGFTLPADQRAANSPAPTRPPTDNGEWTQLAVRSLIARGTSAYLAQQLTDRYLQGGQQLTAEEASLISTAIGDVGPPPFPPAAGPAPLPPASTAPGGYDTDLAGYVVSGGRIVDRMSSPGGGEWQLTEDGSVYAAGSAPYLGGANGQSYFAGRRAAQLIPNIYGVRPGYTIVADNGATYSYPV